MNIRNSSNSFLKRLHAGARQDLARDWVVSLIVSAIALTSVVVWNIWAFDRVARGGIIGSEVINAPTVFNNASLDVAHDIFAKRAIEKAKYETGAYRYADPSQ